MKERLLELLKILNLKPAAFAKKINKAQSTVCEWFKDINPTKPNAEAIINMYKTFNVNPNWLTIGIGKPFISDMSASSDSPKIKDHLPSNGLPLPEHDSPSERLKTPQTDFEEMQADIKLIKSAIVTILEKLDRLLSAKTTIDEQAEKITALTPEHQKQKRLSKLNGDQKTKNKQSP